VPDVYNIAIAENVDYFVVFGQLKSGRAGAHNCGGYFFEKRQGVFSIDRARLVSTKRLGLYINLQSLSAQE
jgi:hypothetical protein